MCRLPPPSPPGRPLLTVALSLCLAAAACSAESAAGAGEGLPRCAVEALGVCGG